MTTVIIKPTDGCNARCRYCSAAHPGAARFMTSATLGEVFRLFGEWAHLHGRDSLKFIWHGGEPLLMPPSFWEDMFRRQEELERTLGVRVEHALQTNATLIRPGTLPLLVRLLGEGGSVGTSADPIPGVRELKGAPDGRYREALDEAMGLLRQAGLRFGILFVVHRLALPDLKSIYRDFRKLGAGLRFNPLYRQGRATESGVWDDIGITSMEWGRALMDLRQAWDEDGRPGDVVPFAPWQRLHDGKGWQLSCECSGNCASSHFGVDPDGSVYPCGRSADGRALGLGQVEDLTAQVLHAHANRRILDNRRAYLRRTHCRECPWWAYCHGGCANDAILASGTPFAPTSFCEGLRAYFKEAFPTAEAPR
jgi:uncharacterized protein